MREVMEKGKQMAFNRDRDRDTEQQKSWSVYVAPDSSKVRPLGGKKPAEEKPIPASRLYDPEEKASEAFRGLLERVSVLTRKQRDYAKPDLDFLEVGHEDFFRVKMTYDLAAHEFSHSRDAVAALGHLQKCLTQAGIAFELQGANGKLLEGTDMQERATAKLVINSFDPAGLTVALKSAENALNAALKPASHSIR
jgi:hypothetical protein